MSKKLLIVWLMMSSTIVLHAQEPVKKEGLGKMEDFISLKRPNGRHVGSYFKGSKIDFQHVNGQRISGFIESVRNDSVFVRQWQVQTYMTSLGTTRVDTAGYYIHKIHYQEIFSIFPMKKESFRYVRNGSIFMIGAGGYALLNVINGAYLDEPIDDPANLRSLGTAVGVFAGGFILNRLYKSKQRKGKQYKIVYVKMTDK